MKIAYNWLNQFLPNDLNLSPEEISEFLTDSGLEVEGVEKIESVKGGLEGLVVGHVLTKEKHPDADKLNLAKVDVGLAEPLNIVCGASNLDAGQKVIVALVGAKLYPSEGEAFVIKKSKIRGQESEGMICAEDEIGLGADHNGIMVLAENAVIGQKASDYFQLKDDFLIEIGLTPNRADAMSHFGVARDLLAVVNIRTQSAHKLINPLQGIKKGTKSNSKTGDISVKISDHERCPRYAGIQINNVKVAASPEWLQGYLRNIGLRPINNVVDITNYVCHGFAQPLHAFDIKAIKGNTVDVRTANPNELFLSLDGAERKLDERDLCICNAEESMCIAGVFGGLHSGVNNETTSIFLESAYFNPVSVRKTAKKLGLSTDASFRFERGIDPNITSDALYYAANLLCELTGGQMASDYVDIYPMPLANFNLEFDLNRCSALIGETILAEQAEVIFSELEISVISKNGSIYQLEVPAYRTDVQRECDVIEEILRTLSFNSIAIPEKVAISMASQRKPEPEFIYNNVANYLINNGFYETMSNSLGKSAYNTLFENEELKAAETVKMLNPLSSELDGMRQNLLFNGLENIIFNLNRRNDNLKLFEYGKSYHLLAEDKFREDLHLSLFLTGSKASENWRNAKEKQGFFEIKEQAIAILQKLGIYKGEQIKNLENWCFAYGQEISIAKKPVLRFGALDKGLLKKFDIKQDVFYADFNWDNVLALLHFNKVAYQAFPKFQSVRRDLSLTLDAHITFEEIETLAKKAERKLLKNVNLFDVYQGKNLEPGKKSYAVSFTLQDDEKTLTDQLVEEVMQRILTTLSENVGASLRN